MIRKGYKFSEEARRKISEHNGSRRPEVREKIRLGVIAAMQRPEVLAKISGVNSPHWKGGLSLRRTQSTLQAYGPEFSEALRRAIRQRDNHQCQVCYASECETKTGMWRIWRFQVHHIDYNKRNNDPENLITLCHKCHLRTNYRRSFWTTYFQKRQSSRKVALLDLKHNNLIFVNT